MVNTRSTGKRASARESRGWSVRGRCDHGPLQIVQPSTSERTDRHNWSFRRFQECSPQELFNLQAHHVERFRIDGVGLGQNRDPALHTQQLQNLEMLAGLRLDRLVGRDDQQHQIDAAHTGQHVAHKAFVPGNVNKPQLQFFAAGPGQLHVREAQINGDAAALLFFQSVGVYSSECSDQCRLSVVDVPGRAYDDRFHVP